ncbi:MAG: soxG [Rhodospirillales bacterium]|nr:soxG [Rhodospirillales bacterium]
MAETFQSPLAPIGIAQGVYVARSLRFTERTGLGHVQLRLADPRATPDLAALERFEQRTGLTLPRAPNRAEGDDPAWIRHAPSRWLALASRDATASLLARLDAARDDEIGLFDLTAARCAIEIEGASAADLLACGCPIDLDPSSFAVDACASTLLGQALVLLHRRAADRFDVHVESSLAPYLWTWLVQAAREFDVAA